MKKYQKIVISRTDNIGDVVLTLPMAGLLKEKFPGVTVYFLGKKYTQPVVESCQHIDGFLDREVVLQQPELLAGAEVIVYVYPDKAIAKAAKGVKVPLRIGTSHRLFHWFTCNRLVNLGRKSSDLHESQLNMHLLRPLGIRETPPLEQVADWYGMKKDLPLPALAASGFPAEKIKLIFHPKSRGSAREWPTENYLVLAESLDPNGFHLYITGTQAEGDLIRHQQPRLLTLPHVTDLTGKLTLSQLIAVIAHVDGLVACSTGPLHIAAASGKRAIGIYPPIRPMHPGRWKPVGPKAAALFLDKDCSDCRKSGNCACIRAISVEKVLAAVRSI